MRDKLRQIAFMNIMANLPGASMNFINEYDIEWEGKKIKVYARGASGWLGQDNFIFSKNFQEGIIYILVGFAVKDVFYWVYEGKDLVGKKSHIIKISNSIDLKNLKKVIDKL